MITYLHKKFGRKWNFLLVAILVISYLLVASSIYIVFMVLEPSKTLGDAYRIFFFHFPNAITTYLAFTVTLVMSILYLSKKDIRYDDIASSSVKLGLVFCTITLITGATFSNATWGFFWNWDPIQTTTMILWFLYAAYLSLRASLDNEESRAALSAVLGIFGYIGVPLTYVSTKIWFSLHPQSGSIGLDSNMWVILRMMAAGIILLYFLLLVLDSSRAGIDREKKRLIS